MGQVLEKVKIPDLLQKDLKPLPIPLHRDNGITLNGGGSYDHDDGNLIKRSDRNILYKSNNKIF